MCASAPVCALTVSTLTFSKFSKMKNVLTVGAQTGACAKKVRHVGQSKVMESHFDLVNPYHADFDVELSLCSKNRILAAGYKKK